MLIIRLQRLGKAKQPSYRLVIGEKAQDTQGRSLEILGNYQPLMKDNQLNLKTERIKYWLEKGAQMSGTVFNLLLPTGLVEGKKRKAVYLSTKRKAKLNEKAVTAKAKVEEAKKAAEVAATEAKAAEVAATEAKAAELAAKEAEAKAKLEAEAVKETVVEPVEAVSTEATVQPETESTVEEVPAETPKEEEKPAE